jgi:hypothetical protein
MFSIISVWSKVVLGTYACRLTDQESANLSVIVRMLSVAECKTMQHCLQGPWRHSMLLYTPVRHMRQGLTTTSQTEVSATVNVRSSIFEYQSMCRTCKNIQYKQRISETKQKEPAEQQTNSTLLYQIHVYSHLFTINSHSDTSPTCSSFSELANL